MSRKQNTSNHKNQKSLSNTGTESIMGFRRKENLKDFFWMKTIRPKK